jgi:hypothetical protein
VNEEHESHQPIAASCEGMPKRPKDYETPDYDMIDWEDDIKHRWPELESVLHDCADIIYPAYHKANSAAIRNQTYHKWLVFVAAIFGMLAVLFAILVGCGLYTKGLSSSRATLPLAFRTLVGQGGRTDSGSFGLSRGDRRVGGRLLSDVALRAREGRALSSSEISFPDQP